MMGYAEARDMIWGVDGQEPGEAATAQKYLRFASLPVCLSASLHVCITASLPLSLPCPSDSLPPCLPASMLHASTVSACLSVCLPPCLSIPLTLSLCLPASLPRASIWHSLRLLDSQASHTAPCAQFPLFHSLSPPLPFILTLLSPFLSISLPAPSPCSL